MTSCLHHPVMKRSRRARGFSLIELMIAVAIVGILAAIAYPSYLDKVRKARRTDAKSLVLQAANREEQLYSVNDNAYAKSMSALGLPSTTDNGYYALSVSQPSGDAQSYTVTATAQGDQVNDRCRQLSVDQTGRRSARTGDGADASRECW